MQVTTDKYTVRSGDGHVSADPVTYAAGSIIDIYVRVTDYNWKYRGFLMNAVNGLNETVGEWTYPELEDANFWSPPTAPTRPSTARPTSSLSAPCSASRRRRRARAA